MVASGGKLLIISYEFPPNVGGIGNHAYNLSKALSSEGYDVTVLADSIDVAEKELEDFASGQPFKINWIRRSKFLAKTYLERVLKSLKLSGKQDKIICTGKFPLWLGILIRAIHSKKELIAIAHGSELDIKTATPKKVTSYALGKFDKIISVSNYTQRFLPGNLPARIQKFVIHNGINCMEFAGNKRQPLSGEPALVTVGSVTERKGQENVIKSLPDILTKYQAAEYHIIGKPVIKEKLERTATELRVEKAVHFHGAVSRPQLLEKLGAASIKLMLSNHTNDGDFEGFGIAVLEANAFGVPVIGSKNSGIADAIVHNKTGLLIDQHNTKEVADAVQIILSNYSTFSANAKAWAIQHDWQIIVKEYVAALNA